MLHQANANLPATDTVSNRASNIQTASEVQLFGCTGFKTQNRKPQTNRNTEQIGNKSTCQLGHHMAYFTFQHFS